MERHPRTCRSFLVLATLGVLLGSSAGCRALVEFVESDGSDGNGNGNADAGPGALDATPDRVDADIDCATWTYTPEHVSLCEIKPAGDALTLSAGLWTYDTNSGALTDPQFDASFPTSSLVAQSDGPELRVLSLDYFELQPGAVLRATGKRPLVIVSWSGMLIDGMIDVSSTTAIEGPGSNPASCADSAATMGSDSTEGASGGGGGGGGSAGANGGAGDDGLSAAGTGGAAVAMPTTLRGGCPGAIGGNSLAGPGGAGGGALHLAARDSMIVNGVLHAGGSGGGASGGERAGGSGAGSGGLIDLQAVTVTFGDAAIIASNGGGGGGGSDGNAAVPGQDALADVLAAVGGLGQGMGKAGGDGAYAAIPAAPGEMAGRGGGGGGGGVGFVLVHASTFAGGSAAVTPAVQQP